MKEKRGAANGSRWDAGWGSWDLSMEATKLWCGHIACWPASRLPIAIKPTHALQPDGYRASTTVQFDKRSVTSNLSPVGNCHRRPSGRDNRRIPASDLSVRAQIMGHGHDFAKCLSFTTLALPRQSDPSASERCGQSEAPP